MATNTTSTTTTNKEEKKSSATGFDFMTPAEREAYHADLNKRAANASTSKAGFNLLA